MPGRLRSILQRPSRREMRRVAALLRTETTGGVLLLVAAVLGLVVANSPWSDAMHSLRDTTIGFDWLHLNLSIGHWTSDGLLAVFFLLAGLELKREFVVGELRKPSKAALPVAAAVGGMAVPAGIYVLINVLSDEGAPGGWAIPSATDIAFALAVLAVVSRYLPDSLRTFLLALAVVDDLLAIVVIAAFYTERLDLLMLGLALIPLGAFAVAVRHSTPKWWLLLPLGMATWVLVHASGVHATVAGVLLAFCIPVKRLRGKPRTPHGHSISERLEHTLRPLSAGVCVPIFAFFASGVTVGGWSGFTAALGHGVSTGIIFGLVLGKPIGIFGVTYLVSKITAKPLSKGVRWADVLALSFLGGIGFTVSLLISDLAFKGTTKVDVATVGVLLGSLISAILAVGLLAGRNAFHRKEYDEADPI